MNLLLKKLQISFNAAENPETFVGDYAFHEPKREQVTGSILEGRVFHILKLFENIRHKLPQLIVITRDGVSEGQHKMVKYYSLNFCGIGVCGLPLEGLTVNCDVKQ